MLQVKFESGPLSDAHHVMVPRYGLFVCDVRTKHFVGPVEERTSKRKKNQGEKPIPAANRVTFTYFLAHSDEQPPPGYGSSEAFDTMLGMQDVPLMYDAKRDEFRFPRLVSKRWQEKKGERCAVSTRDRWAQIVLPSMRYGETKYREVPVPWMRHAFNAQYIEWCASKKRTCAQKPRCVEAPAPSLYAQTNIVEAFENAQLGRRDRRRKGKLPIAEDAVQSFMHASYSDAQKFLLVMWRHLKQ